MKRIAFLSRPEFHYSLFFHVFNQTFQNLATQAGACHLASAKEDGGLDLVALFQEADHMILLRLVVMIIHVNAELHFLDGDDLLVFLRLALLFLHLVQEFPVIHDAANRWSCGGRDFDQVEILFAGHLERFVRGQNPDLLPFVVNHADFACPDTLVRADKTFVDTVLRPLFR